MSHRTNITLCVKAPNAETAVKAVNAILGKKKDDGSHSNVVNKPPKPVSGGQFIVHLLPISGEKFKKHSGLLADGVPLSINEGKIQFFLHRKEEPEFTLDQEPEFTVDKPPKRGGSEDVSRGPSSKKKHDPDAWTVFTTTPNYMTKNTIFSIMNSKICPNVATGCILKDQGKFQTAMVFLNKETASSNKDMQSFLGSIIQAYEEDGFVQIDYKHPDGKDGFLKFMMGKKGKTPSFTKDDLESLLGKEKGLDEVVGTSGAAASEE